MKKIFLTTAFFLLFSQVFSQNNKQLALTPPMGFNSWNFFEYEVSDAIIRQIADAMAENGMRDAGYQYIIIDDFWVGGRDAENHLFPDPKRFPNGIKALADYVHAKGMKLGIYSDAAPLTCGGVTASLGFEEMDAKTFAEWGIDYLKYDYCGAPADVTTAFTRYKKMSDALKAAERPIVFAVCEWGVRKPWLWAQAAGGNLWRTTYDSRDVWFTNDRGLPGIIEIFDQQENIAQYAMPGAWNDPDMLMVGLYGKGKSSSAEGKFKGCTTTEYRTHFALWAMLAAPLIVNNDVRNMDKTTLDILTQKDIIAIDQDPLGKSGVTIYKDKGLQIIKKELAQGDIAICILNRADEPATYLVDIQKQLGIWFPFSVKNIYSGVTTTKTKILTGNLETHGCDVYRFSRLEK